MNDRKPDKVIAPIMGILLLTLLLTSLGSTSAISTELTVLYSNDIRGETEPCG